MSKDERFGLWEEKLINGLDLPKKYKEQLKQKKMRKIEVNIKLTNWHLIPFRHLDNNGFTWLCFQVLIY